MNKNAEISMQMIVFAIIAMVVLAVILVVFRGQIMSAVSSLTGIGKELSCPKELPSSPIFSGCSKEGQVICRHPGCLYNCEKDGRLTLKQECPKGCSDDKTDCKK